MTVAFHLRWKKSVFFGCLSFFVIRFTHCFHTYERRPNEKTQLRTLYHNSDECKHWHMLHCDRRLGTLSEPLLGSAFSASVMSATTCTSFSALMNSCAIVSSTMAHRNDYSSQNLLSSHISLASSLSEQLLSRTAQQSRLAYDTFRIGLAVIVLPSFLHQVWCAASSQKLCEKCRILKQPTSFHRPVPIK